LKQGGNMLINILGMWIMSSSIFRLEPVRSGCDMFYRSNSGKSVYETIQNKTCDEVAAEINKQIKGE